MQFPTDIDNLTFLEVSDDEIIEQLRRDWDRSAHAWKRYIEETYPERDAKEEYRLIRKIHNIRDLKRCHNFFITKKNLKNGSVFHVTFTCGLNDCPHCTQAREDETFNRIVNIPNATIAGEPPEGKDNYYRLKYKGKIVYVIEGGEGQPLNDNLAREIAQENRLKERDFRPSGNLGKREVSAQNNEDKAKIKRRPALIIAPKETVKKIEDEATVEAWPERSPKTEEELQAAVTAFEDALKRIARKYDDCEAIHYLRIETVYIDMEEVNWQKPPG